ncbi:caspase family protein [Parahaliea mediterranea]|uniref:Caspase family protein n=1 Tax=Parahaliea mediterranea TaxID=651086 RepID=A0A939IH74_9GAMM|nr:caspase family protein [Parahaliea mediterranea]MBN7794999.1 caspase family protein [Parahaliea mediterranea]
MNGHVTGRCIPASGHPVALGLAFLLCGALLVSACDTTAARDTGASRAGQSGDSGQFYIVDCLLPGQVRKLGGSFSYVTQRRPIKTAQSDCEIRGGEYVAYDRADYSTALRFWMPLAQSGDPAAQTYVGEIYEKGLGLQPDFQLAARWYGQAADQGFSRAQINLGHLYEKGLGVTRDKQRALNLYRSASGLVSDNLMFASSLVSDYVPRGEYEDVRTALAEEQRRSVALEHELSRVETQLQQQSSRLQSARTELQRTGGRLEQALAAQQGLGAGGGEPSARERELRAQVEQMEGYRRELELQMSQLSRQNAELGSSQQSLVAELSRSEAQQARYEEQIAELQRHLGDSRRKVQRAEQDRDETSAALTRLSSSAEPRLQALQRDLTASTSALTDARMRQAELETERDTLAGELASSERQVSDYRRQLDTLQSRIAAEQQRLDQSKQQVSALRARLADQHASQAVPNQALQAAQRELAQRSEALLERQRQYRQLEQQRQALESTLATSEQRQQAYRRQVDDLQQALAASGAELSASRGEVEGLRQQLAELQSRDASLSPELARLQSELEAKSEALAREKIRFAELESQSHAQQQQLTRARESAEQLASRMAAAGSDYQREKSGMQAMLADREQQFEELQHQLLLTRAELQMAQSERQQALERQDASHRKALERQQRELEQLMTQLESQYDLVKSQRSQIAELEQQAREYQFELSSVDSPAGELIAMADNVPAIEIIEPPVVLTRSQAQVRLRSFEGERPVIGRITAPAGLLSLSVNGQPVDVTDNNLFRSSVPIGEDPTPVEVVLVDREGHRAAVSFAFVDQHTIGERNTRTPIVATQRHSTLGVGFDVPLGNYHALVIGNNDYQHMSTLVTAVNDARETERLLRDKYRFKTTLLLNASRYEILAALNRLRETLGEDDNLLIYYAGHGRLDERNGMGYWLPVDAEQDNNINWISNTAITDILNAIEAKHILVVADSCYSGTLTQTPIARLEEDMDDDLRNEWVKVMAQTRARITLTSGGVQPVLDGGGGQHSVFSRAFLTALRQNDGLLEGYQLYTHVLERMSRQSPGLDQPQVPQYAPVHLAGHESGEFFFKAI